MQWFIACPITVSRRTRHIRRRKRYRKYFRNPEIREFDMQHEQWLLGNEEYTIPVLEAIDEFMETPV